MIGDMQGLDQDRMIVLSLKPRFAEAILTGDKTVELRRNNTDSTHVAFVHSGSFGADQDPRVPVGTVERSSLGISITYGEMPVARTPTSQRPGTRHSVTETWMPFVQVGRMHYSDGSTHILVKGCCPVQDGVTDVHLTVLRNDLAGSIDRQSIIDFEMAVELEDKAVLETLPGGLPPRPETPGPHQARSARHRLPPRPHRLPRRRELETVPLGSAEARANTCMLSTLTIRKLPNEEDSYVRARRRSGSRRRLQVDHESSLAWLRQSGNCCQGHR